MSWADVAAQDREISARRHQEEVVPCMRDHRDSWFIVQYRCNYSAFNGYHYTPSDYSLIGCAACGRRWRTKAAYVGTLARRART